MIQYVWRFGWKPESRRLQEVCIKNTASVLTIQDDAQSHSVFLYEQYLLLPENRKVSSRDIHYIWLASYEKPDFVIIYRFRNRVKKEINEVFTQNVLLLSSKGFISLYVEYIGGTKIESKANKYIFMAKDCWT